MAVAAPERPTAADFSAMATARSKLYDFLSGLSATKPSSELVKAIKEGTFFAFLLPFEGKDLPKALEDALRTIIGYRPGASPDGLEEDLAVEWTKIFRGVQKGYSPPPPYESVYLGGGILQGEPMRTVSNLYATHGLQTRTPTGELPDYIAMEFKFMSVLAAEEAEAWTSRKEDALSCLLEQKRFLREHLLRWVPKFCDEARKHIETEFYKGVIDLFQALLRWDVDLIDELIETASDLFEPTG